MMVKNNLCKIFRTGLVHLSAFVFVSALAAGCSGDDGVAGGSSGDSGIVAVKDWEVAGVSQKGPFVTGSAVTVQELDGMTLKQTGKSFKGTIKSDRGDFAIKDINLESQYAILEATGYYRDEISGKKSSGMVTLRAITDLSNRKTVNINLLTHLEYERVKYLVAEKKMPIADAKAQAEKEILSSFNINGDFAESEDLNIFESGDGNAALLAVSVLMQSDVDVAGLTERMGEFSIAIADAGSWDDSDTKTAIADWACDVDLKGTLSKVRINVENWKYADSVPSFEKYVTNFWWDNYGLGVCNEKREKSTKRNVNKLSKLYDEYFVCEKGRWTIPVDDKSSSSKTTKSSSSGTVKSSSSKTTKSSSSSKKVEPAESSSSSVKTEVSSSGISYGVMKDSRDGQEYKTVRIGNQVWMAENLNYAIEGSLCYGDDEKNCEKYGRLYNWDIALDTTSEGCGKYLYKCTLKSDFYPRQGVCPDGWHLPNKGEWMNLVEYAENNSSEEGVAFSLQSYYWDDDWERQYGTDKFGFNAMPAGMFDGEKYVGLDSLTDFWTSSKTEMAVAGGIINTVDYVVLEKKYSEIWYRGADDGWALSVRCVKGTGKKRGDPPQESESSSSYFDPFAQKSSSSRVVQKKDSLPDLPDELSFVEKYLEKKTEYTEYADGKQVVWRGNASPMYRQRFIGDSTVAPWDSVASALIKEAVANGFEYMGSYSNDSLDNIYVNDSYVYSKTSGGRVYTVVITMHDSYGDFTFEYNYFFLKMIDRDAGIEEVPTEQRKDYNSPQYRDLPEDLNFIKERAPRSGGKAYSNDSLWTTWTFYTMFDTDGTRKIEDAKTAADEYAEFMESHGFTLVSQETLTMGELQKRGLASLGYINHNGEEYIQTVLYSFEKDVEGFHYEAEVYANIIFIVGSLAWNETHANIRITIHDK